MKKVLLISVLFTIIASMNSCVTRINPGYVGLKVNLSGDDKGHSSIKPAYGWEGYVPWLTQIVKIYVRNQHYITNEPIDVNAKGGTKVVVHPSFNYRIDYTKVDSLYISWGVTDDKQIEGKLLEATLLTSMREVTNSWTIDSLLNYRAIYDGALQSAMENKLNPYVHLFQFTSGVQPDASMAAAIADKAGSIQRAQAAENKKREKEALAALDVITARKDSSVAVITAAGEARANQLRQQSLTPLLVQQQFIEKWNGQLPTYGTIPQMFKDITK